MPPVVVWKDRVIIAAIHAKVLEAIEASAREVRREAIRLAPKRRVFKGQRRAQSRQLTKAEIASEITVRRRLGLATSGKFNARSATHGMLTITRETRGVPAFPDTDTAGGSLQQNPYLRGPGRRPITKGDTEDALGNSSFREASATQGRMRSVNAQKQLNTYGRNAVAKHPRLASPEYSGTFGDQAKIIALKKSNSAFYQNQSGKWQLGGRLKGEIRYEMDVKPHKIIGTVISPTYYARYVEFGTRHARGQPYMRPALAKERRHVRKRIASRLQNLGAPR